MIKWLVLLLIFSCASFALSMQDALSAREKARQVLKSFHPESVLRHYTDKPNETQIIPHENSNTLSEQGLDALKEQGLNALKENETANRVFEAAQSRAHIQNNPKSIEMLYAEKLLDNADSLLDGCYQQPGACHWEMLEKTCEETPTYQPTSCGSTLTVRLNHLTQSTQRIFLTVGNSKIVNFDLSQCRQYEPCQPAQLIQLDKRCLDVQVSVTQSGNAVAILKAPSCQDTTMTVQLNPDYSAPLLTSITVIINQRVPEDSWQPDKDCQAFEKEVGTGVCIREQAEFCVAANQTKVIEGIPIQRPCWGKQNTYQCMSGLQSTCRPLLNEGCSHVGSVCTQVVSSRCHRFLQTFRCPNLACLPEQTLCPGKMACAEGNCDESKTDESDDINEGISHLAAVVGSAQEMATQDILTEFQAHAFKGEAKMCETYPLGFRDCCKDSGWGDWVIHCPKDLQALLKAKQENRVVYLGKYEEDFKKHHVWCVFPSKLAGIVQIQGRGQQLGLPFGSAKEPDCRGLSAQELSALDFSKLNLSPLVALLRANITPPNPETYIAQAQSHIERLKEKEKAHD